jgi:hypothetical protein
MSIIDCEAHGKSAEIPWYVHDFQSRLVVTSFKALSSGLRYTTKD